MTSSPIFLNDNLHFFLFPIDLSTKVIFVGNQLFSGVRYTGYIVSFFLISYCHIPWRGNRENALQKLKIFYFVKMSDVSCVIFYTGKMLQTIEFPQVALNINLFEGPLYV
jgi:hypothetical protein